MEDTIEKTKKVVIAEEKCEERMRRTLKWWGIRWREEVRREFLAQIKGGAIGIPLGYKRVKKALASWGIVLEDKVVYLVFAEENLPCLVIYTRNSFVGAMPKEKMGEVLVQKEIKREWEDGWCNLSPEYRSRVEEVLIGWGLLS